MSNSSETAVNDRIEEVAKLVVVLATTIVTLLGVVNSFKSDKKKD